MGGRRMGELRRRGAAMHIFAGGQEAGDGGRRALRAVMLEYLRAEGGDFAGDGMKSLDAERQALEGARFDATTGMMADSKYGAERISKLPIVSVRAVPREPVAAWANDCEEALDMSLPDSARA